MACQVSLDTTGLFETFEHPSIVTSHVEYTTKALGFKTVEMTYGSGLFAARIVTELIIEYSIDMLFEECWELQWTDQR